MNGETHESAKSDDIAWASDGRASAISIWGAMADDSVGINVSGIAPSEVTPGNLSEADGRLLAHGKNQNCILMDVNTGS